MKIRSADHKDSNGLARVQVDSYRNAYAGILPEEYLDHFTYREQEQDWLDWFETHQDEILKVAIADQDQMAGYALGCRNTENIPPYESELVALHIRREYQLLGLGLKLVSAVSKELMARGCRSLFLWVLENNPARSFYEKLGGVLISRKPWQNNLDFGTEFYEVAYGWPDIRSIVEPEMTSEEVIDFLELLDRSGIEVCLDGGWAVDALIGRQTRPHADLDIAIQHQDVALIRTLLEGRGYREVPRDDTRECNFVLGDDQGHEIDIHSYTFDPAGRLVFGVEYPLDSLNGTGSINGFPVRCITPEWLVKFHSGYKLDESDYHDVKALCDHFGIELPLEYKVFKENNG